jgi:hypothetical protein
MTGRNMKKFKKDLSDFGEDLAGYVPGVGQALQIRGTYKKAKNLKKSGTKVYSDIKRKIRNRVNHYTRYFK